jgi:hypothetical protein
VDPNVIGGSDIERGWPRVFHDCVGAERISTLAQGFKVLAAVIEEVEYNFVLERAVLKHPRPIAVRSLGCSV